MTSNLLVKRVKSELAEVRKNKECLITLDMVGDQFDDLEGKIAGPPDTPYEGGTFSLKITLPNDYPFSPPNIRFITKVWHPNVSSVTGAICLDVLTSKKWKPSMSMKTAMLSLQILLQCPEPNDPLDWEVAKQYIDDQDTFQMTAKFWTSMYAGGMP